MSKRVHEVDRFLTKFLNLSGCWVWQRARQKSGYGYFKYKNKNVLAHRWSYEKFVGPIPPTLFVLHKCDNRLCVKPSHLFLGNNQDNMDDKVQKNRQSRLPGELNGRAKLTEANVLSIRIEYTLGDCSQLSLAKKFGVGKTQIRRILAGESWGWL